MSGPGAGQPGADRAPAPQHGTVTPASAGPMAGNGAAAGVDVLAPLRTALRAAGLLAHPVG